MAETVKKKKKKLTLTQKRAVSGYMFILPWILGFAFFYVRCLFMTFQFSFSHLEVEVTGGYSLTWVGIENFKYIFAGDPYFKQRLVSSLGNMLIDVPLIIFFSLFMAMLLNRDFKGRSVVRAIFFLPVILSAGAVSDTMDMARNMMNGGLSSASAEITAAATGGGVSIDYYIQMFSSLGLPDQLIEYVSGAVTRISDIISSSGVQIVLFIAALQSIPGSLYEVAKIEGATAYETFWKVTFPMVMPHIITNFVYTVVDKFADSEIVKYAETTQNYGYSSAMSLVSTVCVCLIIFVVVKLISRKTFYYN